jgi:hypothetical protein
MTNALPPSPFGAPRSVLEDIGGCAFGAFVKTTSGSRAPLHGFFIEPAALSLRMKLYEQAAPGSPVGAAFLACAAPAPILALSNDWRPDWRKHAERSRPAPSDREFVADSGPSALWQHWSRHELRDAFAYVAMPAPRTHGDEDEQQAACAEICALWRQELASLGIESAPWSGQSLRYLHNGHRGEDILAQAREEALGALLATELRTTLRAPDASAHSARI